MNAQLEFKKFHLLCKIIRVPIKSYRLWVEKVMHFLAAAPPSVQQRSTSKAMAGWLADWLALTMHGGRTDGRLEGEVGLDGPQA